MKVLEILLLTIYGAALFFIFFYSMMQLHLVFLYLRHKMRTKHIAPKLLDKTKGDLPFVTIQLPIFNELYVVERLIDSVAKFDYPKDKYEIQVLDDSTDETLEISAEKVKEYKAKGYNIELVSREDRVGYKAGALAHGMKTAKGKYIAIFDADFIPRADFLLVTLPYFEEGKIGAVQTKWGHINRNYSLLTRLQAFGLDAHFTLEQLGRNAGGHCINFNGTAGIWLSECIADAGGWEADTLTEDLDLSYRAQVKGWRFKYLENIVSPAELPAAINALRTQQFRWTKGGAETARKNVIRILHSDMPLSSKIHGVFHLLNSGIFLCILLTAVLSVPILVLKNQTPEYNTIVKFASFFLLSLVSLSIFYFVSLYQYKKTWLKTIITFIPTFPLFLAFSMGLSLHNTIAVLEGYIGYKTPFIRTPKFNINKASDKWTQNKYISRKISPLSLVEGLLAIYFIFGIRLAFYYQDFGLVPFHLMLSLGFGSIFYYSLKHAGQSK